MYECYACNKEYIIEEKAKTCCTETIKYKYDDGDFAFPRKSLSVVPSSRTHCCPNVQHGDKSWLVWLKPEEKCPMCDYVWRPR